MHLEKYQVIQIFLRSTMVEKLCQYSKAFLDMLLSIIQIQTFFVKLPQRIRLATAVRLWAASGSDGPKLDATGILAAHGIDLDRVQHQYPHALRYDPVRIFATIAALNAVEVDSVKALNRWPQLWKIDPRGWEERFAALREMNIDAMKVFKGCPSILSFPADTLRAKMKALSAMGFDVEKVVKRCPTVFSCSEIRIRNTLDFLNSVGLDGVRIVNAYPSVLCFCVDTKLRPVVHFVTIVMGRDVRALQKNPACLGFSLHGRLIPRYQFAILHHKQHLSLGTLFIIADERFVNSLPQSLGAYRDFVAEYRRE